MEREGLELGRLLGRLEHPSCSLNVLKVMPPSVYLAVSRGAWTFVLGFGAWGRGNWAQPSMTPISLVIVVE